MRDRRECVQCIALLSYNILIVQLMKHLCEKLLLSVCICKDRKSVPHSLCVILVKIQYGV